MSVNDKILRTANLCKHFGALKAINNINIEVKKGEFLSIIGPNGAGKTTLFNLITGNLTKTSGRVFFREKDISKFDPQNVVRLGIGRSFQITNILNGLTVFQNILMSVLAEKGKTNNMVIPTSMYSKEIEISKNILRKTGMLEKSEVLAGNLSHGDKKRLEIGMAIALEPILLLLDEPTAGMSAKETEDTVHLIKELHLERTIIMIEHDINIVFAVSERIVVLHQGEVLAEGSAEDIRANTEVRTAYLGEAS